jgi:aerobic carbon-monoxide dehydrogenase small subunit
MPKLTLHVNGRTHHLSIEDRWSLADVLRERCGLTGTHVGCEQGICGACTVLLNGEPVRSCLLLAAQCDDAAITTVEGGDTDPFIKAAADALVEENALQCGFCTPGFVMLLAGLQRMNYAAEDEQGLRDVLSSCICRCTGYAGIIRGARKMLHGPVPVAGEPT